MALKMRIISSGIINKKKGGVKMNISSVSTKQLEWWQLAQVSQVAGAQSNLSLTSSSTTESDESSSVSISSGVDKMSKFVSAVNGMSDSQKTELADLLEEAETAMKSGDFDADALAAGVSADLQSELSSYGVDLSGTLDDIYSDYQQAQSKTSIDYSSALSGGTSSKNNGKLLQMLQGVVEGDSLAVASMPPPPPEGTDKMGSFASAVSSMSDSEKTELETLLEEAQTALESGTYDADTLLDGVSDELKSALASNGVDLESTLQDIYNDYQNRQSTSSTSENQDGGLLEMLQGVVNGDAESVAAMPPPPPPPPGGFGDGFDKMGNFMTAVDNMSDTEKTELEKLLEDAQTGLESGNFDMDALISGMSEGLKSELSSYGVDIEDTLNDIANDYQSGQSSSSSTDTAGTQDIGLQQMLMRIVQGSDDSEESTAATA